MHWLFIIILQGLFGGGSHSPRHRASLRVWRDGRGVGGGQDWFLGAPADNRRGWFEWETWFARGEWARLAAGEWAAAVCWRWIERRGAALGRGFPVVHLAAGNVPQGIYSASATVPDR